MSAIPFSRTIGTRSGVRLGYIKDASERFVGNDSGQVFAGVGRFTRGRIDRAFEVNRDQMVRLLGAPASTSLNPLNEALVQIYDAFKQGATRAVISRLAPAGALLKWMVAKPNEVAGAQPTDPPTPVWSVTGTAAEPEADFLLAIRHAECFNDGVRAEIHALAAEDGDGVPVASQQVVLRVLSVDGALLFNFTGSLDPLAKNESGESSYLPDVVSAQTDNLEVIVAEGASVPVDSVYYGDNAAGKAKTAGADLLYFVEGGTTYAPADIQRAVAALKNSMYPFRYICGLGTKSTGIIGAIGEMGPEINKNVVLDVPGNLNREAAIIFANQFNFDSHYVQWYWSPNRAVDPLNGGKAVIGVSGFQVGLRCRRNANTDANGVPPMNYPIAGKAWPLVRTGIVQLVEVGEDDLELLAKARINPVIYQTYNNGSAYVFYDSLTAAKTDADRKLIAVAEMSSQVDDWVTAGMKEYLQLPMRETIKRGTSFLRILFDGIETAQWLVPSEELDQRSYVASVNPNQQRPKDRVDVRYSLSYDGTTRVIDVEQTISK